MQFFSLDCWILEVWRGRPGLCAGVVDPEVGCWVNYAKNEEMIQTTPRGSVFFDSFECTCGGNLRVTAYFELFMSDNAPRFLTFLCVNWCVHFCEMRRL